MSKIANPANLESQSSYHNRAVALANKTRPDLTKLKEVIIDAKTRIYIDPEKSSSQAKADFIKRVEESNARRFRRGK